MKHSSLTPALPALDTQRKEIVKKVLVYPERMSPSMMLKNLVCYSCFPLPSN